MSKFLQYFQKTDATAARLEELEAKIANMNADADSQDAALAEALEKVATLETENARLQTEAAAQLEALKAEHDAAIESLKAEHDAAIAELKNSHANNVQTEAARVAASQGAEMPLPSGQEENAPGNILETYGNLTGAAKHKFFRENKKAIMAAWKAGRK